MPGKYLRHFAEPEARVLAEHPPGRRYRHCLVIPAYRESARVAEALIRLGAKVEELLIILVLNRPDGEIDPRCNDQLRRALLALPAAADRADTALASAHSKLLHVADRSDLLLVERPQPLPSREGVGLARKLGCDIAAGLHDAGRIQSRWLHNSDADARLPGNYFSQAELQTGEFTAITHPFVHRAPQGEPPGLPMTLYELRLHYYVRGLRSAGSPYAFHTLGSCLSIDVEAYQRVRGFPRRAGAEDFYLLNKVAKLGPVSCPGSPLVTLEARLSDRVPFGTGPAVQAISRSVDPLQEPLFCHPDCFHVLRALLDAVPGLHDSGQALQELGGALEDYPAALQVLEKLGIENCLRHCRKQSRSRDAFTRHFSQWFDGFRTLKLIHGLREPGWQDLNLAQSLEHPLSIWPQTGVDRCDPQTLLRACLVSCGWQVEN